MGRGACPKEAQATLGHIRQCIKRALLDLSHEPRPTTSKKLEWPPETFEPRRIRIEDWRIIYAVNDAEKWV